MWSEMVRYLLSESRARAPSGSSFFFFNDTATTEIYTLSLHDALPISRRSLGYWLIRFCYSAVHDNFFRERPNHQRCERSEEHTSELQSPCNLVCRLLLEKKKKLHDGDSKPIGSERVTQAAPNVLCACG